MKGTTVRFRSIARLGSVALILCASCRAEPARPNRQLFLRFVPLEPKTNERVSTFRWSITTAGGFYEGEESADGEPIRFQFPGTEPLVSLSLRGFDSMGRLIAYGEGEGPYLEQGTAESRSRIRFSLVDEFQAFTETAGPPLFGHAVYVGTDGVAVYLGGSDPEATNSVEAFDHRTGLTTSLSPLSYRRMGFGRRNLPDGRILIAGGSGQAGAESTAEIWDPGTRTATNLEDVFGRFDGRLSFPRPSLPSIVPAGPSRYWVIDGMDLSQGGGTADVIDLADSVGFFPSLTGFDPKEGDTVFSRRVPDTDTYEFYRWGGVDSGQYGGGLKYLSTSGFVTGTFGMPVPFLSGVVVAEASQTVLWGGEPSQPCNLIIVVPTGTLPGSATTLANPEGHCYPALVVRDNETIDALGGIRRGPTGFTLRDDVYVLDLSSLSLETPVTPDGRSQKLVYARGAAESVQLSNGSVLVIGGLTSNSTIARIEVRTAAPSGAAQQGFQRLYSVDGTHTEVVLSP